ncbi:MAG TPA: MBL fold metallo-hydrolase, partial [Candidatus Cybelea sp.]|nr:MBL fold metallo-hydrolase [Candidatus Cybelea sp.]
MSDARVIQFQLAQFRLPDSHPLAPGDDAVYGFVVRDAENCILVDSGIGTGSNVIERLYAPRRIELSSALAQIGVSLGDITAVVNTHLHFDHCGNNRLFPGVPIFVQQAELDAAREPRYTVREWVDFEHSNYVPVRGTHSISPRLTLLATPGHTRGHQSLLVRSHDAVEIIVGQAAYTAAEFQVFRESRTAESRSDRDRYVRLNASWFPD